MKPTHARTVLAGIAGGLAMNIVMLLTFRLLGFGSNGDGILLDASTQSKKLIAVWTEIEPIPLVVDSPAPIIVGIVIFGIIHAYLFRWLSETWPKGIVNRGLRFGGLVFVMTFLFWEFFTPFNLFGEPLHLIALELLFWGLIALSDGLAISVLMHKRASDTAIDSDN
ncbi:hypothetical protein [Sulfurimonas sp. HSL3-7]|uniref:hypothetical protein n=1 Tax=Sulfonitrofixus jiaomeiensis TaxID=3131938 RepID=UPI0031F97D98